MQPDPIMDTLRTYVCREMLEGDESLGPDTLVVIFGDHGFHWQANERGTSAAQRGGALPEQVLVPASAWLLGGSRPRPGTAPGLH